jgi:ATP-dependent DNA helicase RecG
MSRKKLRSNPRHEPSTERSYHEYYYSQPLQQTSRTEILRLIRGGEDTFLELKVKLSNTEKIAQEIVALANTGGGTIVFGVNDQLRVEGVDDPENVQDELVRICREDITPPLFPMIDRIAFDSGKRIVALDVEGKRRPYRTNDGRFFIRIGSEKREATREELSDLIDEARPLGYENIPVLGANERDIDEALLWSFVKEFSGDAFAAEKFQQQYPTGEMLKRELLLAAGNTGEVIPTVAGILLFGKNESVIQLLPRSQVVVKRFAGDTTQSPQIESATLQGNLLTLYESSLRFVKKYCDLWDERHRSFANVDENESPIAARANYHQGAIKEAIANALVHRDLTLRDTTTRIHIFDHAIEIINPRRSNGFMLPAQKAIRYGIQQRLNPQIASVFYNSAYGANIPQGGLPMLLRESRLFSEKNAEMNFFNDEFRLRIFGA